MRRFAPLLLVALYGCPTDPVDPPPLPPEGFHDPLSMPEAPTVDPAAFTSATVCQGCHPTHYAEWTTSRHAYAMKDEVFRALVEIRQMDYGGAQDQFCTQCHSAICARGGECVDNFTFEGLPEIALEGVTCEACHKVAGLERTFNSGHVLDPAGPMRGPFADPAPSPFHDTVQSELLTTSEFCGGCHDVVEVSGLNLERPYAEWITSPAAGTDQTCQACHMPAREGQAAEDGPARTVHDHRFIGVDVPAAGVADAAEIERHRARVQELLTSTATLAVEARAAAGQVDLLVTVQNLNEAHDFPTGTTFIRQAWIEVTVDDAAGRRLYETGGLDANGDLRDAFSDIEPYGDDDLLSLSSSLVDARGNPTIFPWRAKEHTSRSLGPGYARTYTLFVPTSSTTQGPLDVRARVRFRPFPPYLLRALGFEAGAETIYEVASARAEVPL